MTNALKNFVTALVHDIREAFHDDDGRTSFTRLATAALVYASIRWVGHVVYATHHLPSPTELVGLGTFMGFLLGINRSDNIAAAIRGTSQPVQTPPDQH